VSDPLVVALGGQALASIDAVDLAAAAAEAVGHIVPLTARGPLVLTHGNGPQIGRLSLESTVAARELGGEPRDLDALDAETEGLIGYALERALRNANAALDPAVVLTQVLVDQADEAFRNPTKPVGPLLSKPEAQRLVRERDWSTREVDGGGQRRVVASPRPLAVLELRAIRAVLDASRVVICAGGGGIPVIREVDGLRGVEAVIDKDAVSALLAAELDASALLLLTDVDGVYLDWDGERADRVDSATAGELETLELEVGTMAPKVAAAIAFARTTGRPAGIGRVEDALRILEGAAGTRISGA
jgi:carbamate kinase